MAQIGSIDFKECAGFYCPGANQCSTTREQIHVAGEFSAIQNVKDSFAIGSNAKHFDSATQYDEDAVMQISPFQNDFVWLRIPLLAKSCKPSNLSVVKLGKHRLDLFGRSTYEITSGHRHFFESSMRILREV
jgi:hypothetical protein